MSDKYKIIDKFKTLRWREKNLLLGNGFSSHLLNNQFSYKKLKEEADFSPLNAKDINEIFSSHKTNDFEFVMKRLQEATSVFKAYNFNPDPLVEDKEKLKDLLVNGISRLHPDGYIVGGLSNHQVKSINKELKGFKHIFTLNYDLLLYWLIMEDIDGFKDGFTNVVNGYQCLGEYDFNINYLHGGLHIFEGFLDDDYEIVKIKKGDQSSLSEQVKGFIAQGWYPVTVAEGDWEGKMKIINSNYYLKKCYRKLKRLKGDLYIFGCSFQQDDHILKAISKSYLKDINIGIRNLSEEKCGIIYHNIFSKVGNRLDGKINFFDTKLLFQK